MTEPVPNFDHAGITRTRVEPPQGYRAIERRTRLGEGDDVRERALATVMSWGTKTLAGFRVTPATDWVREGDRAIVTLGPMREPVEVAWVSESGFGYVTLHGHPLRGEECFLVEMEAGGVWFVNRSVSRPATSFWMVVSPLLRIAQWFFVRRYARVMLASARVA